MVFFIHGHRTLKAPHPVRSAQLTRVPPSQYHGGGPRGNPGCCGFFFFCLFFFVVICKILQQPNNLFVVSQMKLCFAADLVTTPCGIWPQQDLRVRFSYLEERRGRKVLDHQGSGGPASWALVMRRWLVSVSWLRLVRLVRGQWLRLEG